MRQHDLAADKMEKKAAAATEGLYFQEVDDVKDMMCRGNEGRLLTECLAAGRVIREWPLSDGRDITAGAKIQSTENSFAP